MCLDTARFQRPDMAFDLLPQYPDLFREHVAGFLPAVLFGKILPLLTHPRKSGNPLRLDEVVNYSDKNFSELSPFIVCTEFVFVGIIPSFRC